MSRDNFDIDDFFKEATNELLSKSVNELEVSFAESGYFPVRKGHNLIEGVNSESINIVLVDPDIDWGTYEAANDDQELSLAA